MDIFALVLVHRSCLFWNIVVFITKFLVGDERTR